MSNTKKREFLKLSITRMNPVRPEELKYLYRMTDPVQMVKPEEDWASSLEKAISSHVRRIVERNDVDVPNTDR